MKRTWLLLLPLVSLRVVADTTLPAAYKVETIGACTNSEVSASIRDALQPQGTRVVGDAGALCELWLRKVIPQKSGSAGTEYNTLANGTFVGVITYPSKAGDYRGQAIKPGTYTLRYQTILQDGNHLGVSPTPDFLLLAPGSADKDPSAAIETAELIKLSKMASASNHPNPLYLSPPSSGGASGFKQSDESHWALEAKTKAQPAGGSTEVDFPLAVILIGKAEG